MNLSQSAVLFGAAQRSMVLAAALCVCGAASCSPGTNDRGSVTSRGGAASVIQTSQGGSLGAIPAGTGGVGPAIGTGIDVTGNNTALCSQYGGVACQIQDCGAQPKTTVTAKVYDPAGKVPLYNVVVYVPSTTLAPIPDGAACETCATPISGKPVAATITDARGQFTLQDVPVGQNVPIVLQVGKWRREVKIPEVKACRENSFSDPNLFRLPRNQSEGHIPKIALIAGDADRLQCLLYRMGLEPSVFTNPDGPGAVNIYNLPADLGSDKGGGYDSNVNAGARYPDARAFWENFPAMLKYDMILLACGGVQAATDPTKYMPYDDGGGLSPISDAAKANMVKYANSGGRVFGEHYHWAWIKGYPSPKPTDPTMPAYPAPFGAEVATWIPYTSTTGVPATGTIDETFPRGASFAEWLVNVGASTNRGVLQLNSDVKPTALDHVNPPGQRWIYEPDGAGPAAQKTHYLSFNTPVSAPAANQCGRFVYTGLHVTGGPDDPNPDPKTTFPSTCKSRDLAAAEKALEFMIFDLSSCVAPPEADPTKIILL